MQGGRLGAVMVVVIWALLTTTPVGAGDAFMSVNEAHKKASAGELLLVDVRRASEWARSGVAANAHTITMHQKAKAFINKLLAAAGGDPTKPLAIICATGGRTAWLQPRLKRAGFTNVINVGEGMFGSRYGPGWIKRGLPITRWPSSKPQ